VPPIASGSRVGASSSNRFSLPREVSTAFSAPITPVRSAPRTSGVMRKRKRSPPV
jgi:hypothetical protein